MVDKHVQDGQPIPSDFRNTVEVNAFDKVFFKIPIRVE